MDFYLLLWLYYLRLPIFIISVVSQHPPGLPAALLSSPRALDLQSQHFSVQSMLLFSFMQIARSLRYDNVS